jgi:hypothetical protein
MANGVIAFEKALFASRDCGKRMGVLELRWKSGRFAGTRHGNGRIVPEDEHR